MIMAPADLSVAPCGHILRTLVFTIWASHRSSFAVDSSTQKITEWLSQSQTSYFQNESLQKTALEMSHTSLTRISVTFGSTVKSVVNASAELTYSKSVPSKGDENATVKSSIISDMQTPTIKNYVYDKETIIFYFDLNKCSDNKVFHFPGVKGEIRGRSGGDNSTRTRTQCQWTIWEPDGYLASSSVKFLSNTCFADVRITVFNNVKGCEQLLFWCKAPTTVTALAVSGSNQQAFSFTDDLTDANRMVEFIVQVQAVPVEENILFTFPIKFTSPKSGYVTSYRFEDGIQFPCGTNATRHIVAPEGHVMMISFPLVFLGVKTASELILYNVSNTGSLNRLEIVNDLVKGPTFLVTSLLLHLQAKLPRADGGFKMHFSFHPTSEAPRMLTSGLWDCSVSYYSTFRQHLECNLEPECQGGEDEGPHCPYSSAACNGSVSVGNKCYEYVQNTGGTFAECRKRGGKIATMKSREEWAVFLKLFQYGKRRSRALIGLRTSKTDWPKYYKYALMWADGTVSYETNTTQDYFQGLSRRVCGSYEYVRPLRAVLVECVNSVINNTVCEFLVHQQVTIQDQIIFPDILDPMTLWQRLENVSVVQCPEGHVTHTFSLCDVKSFCGRTKLPVSCMTRSSVGISVETEMFVCDDHLTTLPYTLVCDFRSDCLDGSDENFCQHDSKCQEFTCRNRQCIPNKYYCDLYKDCWDGSDEDCLSDFYYEYPPKQRLFAPAVVYFDGQGEFYQITLSTSEPCPQTHFRCAGESAYCLPVYVRCNGVYDCPSHEDEDDCLLYTCPGFYRCRGSSVCVHADNVCDGWPQCPQHDDEAFCGLRCPDACDCQGLAFVCGRSFIAKDYPEMRYLDATGSTMTLYDMMSNTYLVWLSLASCSLTNVYHSELPNLQVLDLSDNKILALDLSTFHSFTNLKHLLLAGNPIFSLINNGFTLNHTNLQSLDVSRCLLTTFDSKIFLEFPNINFLNMSLNGIEIITHNKFTYLPRLAQVDVRKNSLKIFPREVLSNAQYLHTVYADNYKLCCKQNLPDLFDMGFCFAPEDEISSCDDLLRSDIYRSFLWLFCALSISGNVGSFLFRQFYHRRHSVSGFGVFVTNLSVSDFLMGVYLAIVGYADETYRSTYLWNDVQWKVSTTCKVAGFVSLMSSEVSALIICLITLDRFIVLRFPFSKFRFERWSASWACGLAWAVGFTLAAVPLLPFLSDWEFYTQNSICIPLPITRKGFVGRSYAFGVMIIFNMALFVVIAMGQICIYWSVRVNSMKGNTTKKSKDIIIARRLATVVVSDFLCWFPVGMVSSMASLGIAVPGEVSVFMIIFVVPLNASLNPFLYTFNLVLEKWREAEEARLMKSLKTQLSSQRHEINSCEVSGQDTSISNVD